MSLPMVAGIDPGGSTGLAIGHLEYPPNSGSLDLIIHHHLCSTLKDPRKVLTDIKRLSPEIIYMERRAEHPSSIEGLEPYEIIKFGLENWGYDFKRNKPNPPKPLRIVVQYAPGIWKPFMKATYVDFSSWEPTSQHEKDAMSILYFGVMLNNPGKKVQYG